jgi:hypothetical protein
MDAAGSSATPLPVSDHALHLYGNQVLREFIRDAPRLGCVLPCAFRIAETGEFGSALSTEFRYYCLDRRQLGKGEGIQNSTRIHAFGDGKEFAKLRGIRFRAETPFLFAFTEQNLEVIRYRSVIDRDEGPSGDRNVRSRKWVNSE